MCNSCENFDRRGFLMSTASFAAISFAPQIATADETSFPGIIPRSQWSLVPPKASPGSLEQYAVAQKPKFVSIHYTAFFARHPRFDARGLVRNLQDGHLKRNFGDIAYHYIVTLPGEIYEGRPLSVAPASGTYYHSEVDLKDAQYLPDGRLAPQSIVSGSAPGHSDEHITVSFNVGIGDPEMLPDEVMEQGAKLIARLLFENGLMPEDVRAHREFANSTCPGDLIYAWLRGPSMQRDKDGPGMTLIRQEFDLLVDS